MQRSGGGYSACTYRYAAAGTVVGRRDRNMRAIEWCRCRAGDAVAVSEAHQLTSAGTSRRATVCTIDAVKISSGEQQTVSERDGTTWLLLDREVCELRGTWHPDSPPDRFNAFQLCKSFEKPLAVLGFAVLRDVSGLLGLPMVRLEAFCLAVDNEMPNNKYHNRTHVADVLQMMHLLCQSGGEMLAPL